jgi:hypothetical protein
VDCSYPRLAFVSLLGLALATGCPPSEYEVPIDFVVPDGHDSFVGLDYLALNADYGAGLFYDFWLEAPESGTTWSIPSIPVGDTVTLAFDGLVGDGLGGTGQVVAASGTAGPLPLGPDHGGVSVLFSRRGRIGRLAGALNEGRRDPMHAVLPDGRVLVVGGSRGTEEDGDPLAISSASVMGVDGRDGSWSFQAVDAMRGPRMNGVAVAISDSGTEYDGKVLVIGTIPLLERRTTFVTIDSTESELEDARAVGAPELFDPSDGSWSDPVIDPAWQEQSARGYFTAHQAGDRVLIIGGVYYLQDGNELALRVASEAFELELATGEITELASMSEIRWAHTSTPLPGGRVLVVGGANVPTSQQTFPEVAEVEVYDPGADSWLYVGDLEPGRADQVAAALPDGRVLIAGGVTGVETEALGDSWVFDPSTNTFSADANMVSPRSRATHSVLADGRVLVCGGEDADLMAVNGCELWTPGSTGELGVWSAMPDPAVAWDQRTGAALAMLPGGEAAVFGGLDADGAYNTDVLVVRP